MKKMFVHQSDSNIVLCMHHKVLSKIQDIKANKLEHSSKASVIAVGDKSLQTE